MFLFITMFICNMLMPLIMLIGGYCMYNNPPKEINGVIGYRTKMSRMNKDTWTFAHDYCGRLWYKAGRILVISTVIIQIPFIRSSENAIGIMTLILEGVQLIVLLGSIVVVEKALKRTFDHNGDRR